MSSKILSTLLLVVATGVYVLASMRGLLAFPVDWDFLAYHLPFAMMHFGLTSFQPDDRLMVLYDAFPPAAHLVQGFLIALTGLPSSAALLNTIGLGSCLLLLKRLFPGFKVLPLTVSFLSIPIVIVHLGSGYIDLWVAAWIFLSFAAALKLASATDWNWRDGAIFIGSLLLACLSKYQAWPFCSIILAYVFASWTLDALARRLAFEPGTKKQALLLQKCAVIFLGFLAVSFWPLRNTIDYGNPTHPLQPPLLSSFIKFEGQDLSFQERQSQIPAYLWESAKPRLFVESALELNRLQKSSKPFHYSVDQGGYPEGPAVPHHRMGGWTPYVVLGGIFFALWRLLIELKTVQTQLLASLKKSLPYLIVGLFVLLLLFIPQNHELRYWTFIPMCLLFLVFRPKAGDEILGPKFDSMQRCSGGYFTLAFFCSVSLLAGFLRPRYVPQQSWASAESKTAVENMKKIGLTRFDEKVCTAAQMPWTIFWAGENFNEVPVKDCTYAKK